MAQLSTLDISIRLQLATQSYTSLVKDYVDALRFGKKNACKLETKLWLMGVYMDMLSDYTSCLDGGDCTKNCMTEAQAQAVAVKITTLSTGTTIPPPSQPIPTFTPPTPTPILPVPAPPPIGATPVPLSPCTPTSGTKAEYWISWNTFNITGFPTEITWNGKVIGVCDWQGSTTATINKINDSINLGVAYAATRTYPFDGATGWTSRIEDWGPQGLRIYMTAPAIGPEYNWLKSLGNIKSRVGGGSGWAFRGVEGEDAVVCPVVDPYSIKIRTSNAGVSAARQFQLPLDSAGTYDFTVDWGDGNANLITAWNQADALHTYDADGDYTVNILGVADHIKFYSGDSAKLLSIEAWGDVLIGNMNSAYRDCVNMVANFSDVPKFSGDVDLTDAFNNATLFVGDLSNWNTAGFTRMADVFNGATVFNSDISRWDVSSVTTMDSMFKDAAAFNSDLSLWDTSSVLDMQFMFNRATVFNQDISSWDVSSVADMNYTFSQATAFNQDIGSWDVSSVTTMYAMFSVSGFNQDLSAWDVSSVTNMNSMFQNAASFNQSLAAWDITSVVAGASSGMKYMILGTAMSTANYDLTLVGWGAQVVNSGIILSTGPQYTIVTSGAARGVLTGTYSWTITDGGGI